MQIQFSLPLIATFHRKSQLQQKVAGSRQVSPVAEHNETTRADVRRLIFPDSQVSRQLSAAAVKAIKKRSSVKSSSQPNSPRIRSSASPPQDNSSAPCINGFLHRQKSALNIREQMKALGEAIEQKTLIHMGPIYKKPQHLLLLPPVSVEAGYFLKPLILIPSPALPSINSRSISQVQTAQSSLASTMQPIADDRKQQLRKQQQLLFTNHRMQEELNKITLSQGVFDLTHERSQSQGENLKQALSFCNVSNLDIHCLAKEKQSRYEQDLIHARRRSSMYEGATHKTKQKPFKINIIGQDASVTARKSEEGDCLQQRLLLNNKLFQRNYAGEDYKKFLLQKKETPINLNDPQQQYQKIPQSSQHQKTPPPAELQPQKQRFQRIQSIKADVSLSLNQLVRLKKLQQQEVHQQMIVESIKKRNQIAVIIAKTKRVMQIKDNANRIEQEISIQNQRIDNLVQTLLEKVGGQSESVGDVIR